MRDIAVGQQFGLLTILEEAPRRNGRRYWLCRCSCGKEKVIDQGHIRSGHTRSCGCITRKYPDLKSGMKVGQFTLLKKSKVKKQQTFWLCRCECGNECSVLEGHLKSGHTKSCGCLSRKHPDYTPGMKIGLLTLVDSSTNKAGAKTWRCRCDCGNECSVLEGHLKSGHTKSCGCLQRKVAEARAIDLYGQKFTRLEVIGHTPKRIKGVLKWLCRCECGNEIYVEAEKLTGNRTKSCGCLRDDKRKENMRNAIHFVDGTCIEKIASPRETAANTSGHRGVYPLKNGTFRTSITFRGKRHDLGTHKTFEEAVDARLKGEEKYFGEYLEEYYARQKEG